MFLPQLHTHRYQKEHVDGDRDDFISSHPACLSDALDMLTLFKIKLLNVKRIDSGYWS